MRSRIIAFCASLVISAFAIGARLILTPILGEQFPFVTLFFAIALVAWFYGTGPAILSLVVGGLSVVLWVMEPVFSDSDLSVSQAVGLGLYGLVGSAIIAMFNSLEKAQAKLLEERNQLRQEVVARQQAETKLADRDMLLRTAFASIGEAIITTDAQCIVTSMNAVAQSLTGWSDHQACGQPIGDVYKVVNSTTGEAAESLAHRVLDEERVVRSEKQCCLIHRDGSSRPIEDSAAPLHDEAGRTIGAVLTCRDVSERQQAEAIQAANATRFRLAAEAVNGIIYERDLLSGNVERTRGLYEVMGYYPDEVPTTDAWLLEQVHPDDRLSIGVNTSPANLTDSKLVCEYRVKHKNGHWLDIEDRAVVVRDEFGNPSKMIGCMVDISVRKGTEQALRESESILRSFYESSPMLMGVVDLPTDDSDIWHVYDSPATDKFFGNTQGSTSGKSARAIGVPSHVIAAWVEHYRRSQRTQSPVRFEHEQLTASGPICLACVVTYIGEVAAGMTRFSYVAEDVTERKRAENALQTERARLAIGVQVAGLTLTEIDFVNDRATLTAEAAQMFGLGHEVLQIPCAQLYAAFHPDDRDEFIRRMDEITQPAGPEWFAIDLRVVWPSGEVRWLRLRKQVFYGRDGDRRRALRGTLAALDVTAERNAAQAVAESEQFVRGVLISLPEHVVVLDSAGMVRAVNNPSGIGEEAHGRMRFEVREGTDYLQVCRTAAQQGDAFAQTALAELQMLLDGQKDSFVLEYPSQLPGKDQWFLMHAKRSTFGPTGAIISHIDITDRVLAEHRLRESQERLFLALEAAFMICFEWDIVKDEVRRTFSTDRILPPTEGDQPWTFEQVVNVVYPEDRNLFRANVEAALQHPEGEYSSEYRVVEADGSIRWFYERGRVEFDADRTPLRLTGLSQDVSVRKLAVEKLKDEDRKKDEFLATLAHELRNPLSPIRNSLELLKHGNGEPAIVDQALVTMDRQVKHMVRLIDDLLDISRITSNKLELKQERVELASIMRYAVEASAPICKQWNHQLIVEYPDDKIWLNADSVRLTQVFVNLITNSCKYMAAHGKIWFSAELDGASVIVKVKDAGVGIAPEMLLRVFDLFAQVDQSLERKQGGLGIGLSLVKRLVEMHQGTVTAHSEGLGTGCEMRVELPIVDDVGQTEQNIETSSAKQAGFASRRVLVVDDNRDAGRTLALLLRVAGHNVQNACDGLEAIEQAEQFRPEIILLDIGLPKMNGFEVCRAIRKEVWGQSIMMVALTGWGQPEDRRKSKEAGFDRHLVKPVDHSELMNLFSELSSVTSSCG